MSWSTVLVLGVSVFAAHSAVHRTQDATLRRIARSPHYGPGFHHGEGPPPPPIVYHTQNWSGVAKGVGGSPQGVFSGAAASAQSAVPASSEAFSIATSGTGPVTSDNGGQVKGNIGKSGFSSDSNSGISENLNAGSHGNKHGDKYSNHGNSGEGQSNIHSGLDLGASEGISEECGGVSGQYNADSTGSETKAAGGISAGYGRSSGQYKSESFDKDAGQRSINTDFSQQSVGRGRKDYGRQNGQYGSSKGFGNNGGGGKLYSGSLTNGNSAGGATADFESESGQYELQTSNKEGLSGFNHQSGKNNAGSSSFGGRATATSGNQFGHKFDSHGGYNSHPSYRAHDDFHRHGKNYHETHFGQGGGRFGNQGNNGQDFGGNGKAHSTVFGNSQSSASESKEGNYGTGSSGSERAYSGNQGQGGQIGKLDAGSGASQELLDKQRQSSSGGSGFGASRKVALTAGNSGVSSGKASEAEGSLSAGASESGREDLQSTVGTALNLASQGLQTAQRTPCSTCEKSNYALSNAKSHSGSAIALSIGG